MIIRAILYCHILLISTAVGVGKTRKDWQDDPRATRCLTGYMTDLQSWVDENGQLTPYVDINEAIDMSTRESVVRSLEQELSVLKSPKPQHIRYLSLAKCSLTRVPSVFQLKDNHGRKLADTLEFLTLYGNNFGILDPYVEIYDAELNATNARELPVSDQSQRRILTQWSSGFHMHPLRTLKELDLRECSIQVLGDYTFQRMPELRKLYLSENSIHFIETYAFDSMKGLKHLDLSRNFAYDENGNLADLVFESDNVFRGLKLESLDFSFTRLGQRNHGIFRRVDKHFKRLSLCYSAMGRLRNDTFNDSSLKLLDVSGNPDVIGTPGILRGAEKTLEVLYADNVSLKNMEGFMNFTHLKILKLSNNEINTVPANVAKTLTNLQILDLDNNRMMSWSSSTFSLMPKLKLLSLKNNNINIISREMYNDIKQLSFLGLSGNFLVCNCHARDMFEVASNNELLFNSTYFKGFGDDNEQPNLSFHSGFKDFNNVIRERRNITTFCEERDTCNVEFNHNVSGNYLLLDYADYSSHYRCLQVSEGKSIDLYSVPSCTASNKGLGGIEGQILESWNKYFLLLLPTVLLPFLLCVYVFRKNFKYFLITIRNSATLSLINKNDSSDDGTIFHYDVFVSYCNEDRAWVLDNLLSHVEKDCNVSVCLHERDFQIGLSILENIVSCMDRSRMIMLIISKRFLLSQWCQFEMHLAQHRLLETRREDLILVLLEEIPRRLRPNTLHYLMLTKTYIVWPQEESERKIFWRRMKKSLVTHKLKSTENVSLA
ncbi:toll-like receptor 13 [Maniola hyperantus]|uniref:toll-like receptor 13 n=1 Tax=Aphantopus hyperantus TaxID=2795564 RepID=UPI00156A0FB2|nr:toll-like receptor 13 [Maniola hyperantus]